MTTLLRHPLTGEWVLYAPSRAGRPGAFESRRPRAHTPPEQCPFCPGNEHETPPEIYRTGSGEQWRIRVVPNRYPAITPEGRGAHEVVIESRNHDARFHSLSPGHAAEVIDTYRRRYEALSRLHDVRFITVFKNDGPDSGQSIDHLHSQILALPVVPPRAAQIANRFLSADPCSLCATAGDTGPLVIGATDTMIGVVPPVALYPYEVWIVPRRHLPAFTQLSHAETSDVAHLMQSATRAIGQVLDDPSLNWVFHNSPIPNAVPFHWFVQLFPRLAQQGGLELGSGMQINVVDPRQAAEELREAMSR